MGHSDPDDTKLAFATNEMSGAITGAVQAGVVQNIHFHTGCAHSDLTPQFEVRSVPNSDDETMYVWFTLVGPGALDRLDEVVVSVRDELRLAPNTITGRAPEDEVRNVVRGARRFRPGVDKADRFGRAATVPYPLEMGDRTRLYLERTFPPAWTGSNVQWWRRQHARSPLRLRFTCRRDGLGVGLWRIPVDIEAPVAVDGR
ncbi:hypothetical protein [Kutzneria buriramensis]|uniref:Uncharacterized protein n=1 Tax=Kutzneria buriramensis TaxID=1045776 RepID=A0A3E0HLL0_9PSEU|nr:hypothetical protein [Kutzneria buriramensis]REH47354.1 hypothetical protein BCF44_106519 [Kutzneria buriramensis]